MKILLISLGYFKVPSDTGGGVEFHTYNLANSLGKLGHEVHYVVDTSEKANLHKNVIVHKIGSPDFPIRSNGFVGWTKNHFLANMYTFRKAKNILDEYGNGYFDLAHGNGSLSSLLLNKFLNGIPMIYTVHNPTPWMYRYEGIEEHAIRSIVWRSIEIPLWKKSDRLIALNRDISNEMIRLGISKNKVEILPNGVDTDFFRRSHNGQNIKEKYNLDNFCLFVGQLVPRKGVHYLLQSLVEVNIPCVVVGDGPQYKKLLQLAKNLKIMDKVIFTGSVPLHDLHSLYFSANFFILPTIAEAFPLVLLEAMACSLPVITTNIGAASEIIIDGYNGFLVEPANAKELSKKIKFLSENPDICKEMGKNARKLMEEKYSWDVIAKRTEEVYKKVLDDQ